MPSTFSADSPLVQAVKSVLRQETAGLTVPEIRRALLKAGRPGVLERDVQQIIQLPDFRRLANGRVILAENEPPAAPESIYAQEAERPELPYDREPSTLRNLPPLDSYVIFDTETNGLQPETADFFQLSAIKVVNGAAVGTFDRLACVDTSTIPYALRKKLHFDELSLEAKIAASGTQAEAVSAFLEFAEGLPLVAHNGTFDIGFLRKVRSDLSNPLVDALELFILIWPTAHSYRLDSLAKDRHLAQGDSRWSEVAALDARLGISSSLNVPAGELFHSAIFDCLILRLLLQDALAVLSGLPEGIRTCFRMLSPALGDLVTAPVIPASPPADLLDLLPLSPWQAGERLNPDPSLVCNETVVQSVYDHFIGRMGWKKRSAQQEMLLHVTRRFTEGSRGMIEASTGTGKTIAYLIPALVQARATGQQVVVSTSTKTLQDQLLNDLQNRLTTNLPFQFRFSILKGQDNYLCLTKLWEAFREAFFGSAAESVSLEEKLCLLYLLRFAAETQDGDLQNTSFWLQSRFPVLSYLKARLASERGVCGSACNYRSYCFHPRAQAMAKQSDLLVVNHTLLLLYKWEEDVQFNLVLDEAHNLEEAATGTLSEEASQTKIEHLLKRLVEPEGKRGLLILARKGENAEAVNRAMGSVRRLRRRVRELGAYLREFLRHQGVSFHPKYGASWRMRAAPARTHFFTWQPAETALKEILNEMQELNRALTGVVAPFGQGANVPAFIHELEVVWEQLIGTPNQSGQCTFLDDIPKVNYDPLVKVHWIELGVRGTVEGQDVPPEKITWAFKRAPVRVDQELQRVLYEHLRTLILTSATLHLAEGGFNFFLDRLGLQSLISSDNLVQLPKEFNYDEQVMLGMPGYLRATASYNEIERFKEEMARELEHFFRFTEGRGLVLHTARTRMEYVARHLEQSLTNLPVYWQREGMSSQILKEDFEAQEESILLGLRSFWEGIDVPGPSLSYLVLEKLLFPVLTEPIIAARCDQMRASGGNEWGDYLIPMAALHFKQGFGRLMRKEDDRGVVLFMDKSLRGGKIYREAILRSLPGYKRTDDMVEAEETRLDFYRSVAEHMRDSFPDWDWDARLDVIANIREEVLPDLERQLRELELPAIVPVEQYEKYRDRLSQAGQLLIEGFQSFRPEQEKAMRSILAGQDTLVVLPTGSGKSLAFQLPALLRNGVTLVFSPLIALMRDQVEKLRSLGLTQVNYIVSGQSGSDRDEVYRRMKKGELRLVYISPERIRDTALVEALKETNVIQAVVDEAHCVHMWGPSFRPDFLKIPSLFTESRPPIAALTATATKETRTSIVRSLNLKDEYSFVTKSIDRPELKFVVYNHNSTPERIASKKDKLRVLVKILRAAQKRDEVAIVYTATVRQAEQLSRILDLHGFSVRHYHGQMTAQRRLEVEEEFREGMIRIIVATKAFGMGIDKSDVRYVVHYDIPGDLESYFQEAGRAGRDGQTAYCVLLYHKSDLGTQKYFIRKAFPEQDELDSLLQAIRGRVNGQSILFVRPDELADESGIDRERLGVPLHLLEFMGFVRRTFNFTVQANVLLNRSPEWLAGHLSAEQVNILNSLVAHTGISESRGQQIDLLQAGQVIGKSPLEIDLFLTNLAAKGWAVYRPWDRGYILEVTEKLLSSEQVHLSESDVERIRSAMIRNLSRVLYFAERLGAGDCRRGYLLKHFDEDLQEHPKPCCDLCNKAMDLPWQDVPSEEVSVLPAGLNPEHVVLRAVEWNKSLSSRPYFSPYHAKTLAYILQGNSFATTRNETDPIKRVRRLQRIESSPYFGVLQGIKGGDKAILNILGHLQEQGYVQMSKYSFSGQSDEINYEAPVLSQQGKQQILTGKYIV